MASQIGSENIIGSYIDGKIQTTLLNINRAGLQQFTLTGNGSSQVSLSVAADLNRDGKVDAQDSSAWDEAYRKQARVGDLDGDGQTNAADRQILYANYGYRANLAPVAENADGQAFASTHVDLNVSSSLKTAARDFEGDTVFWRVLGSSHGQAQLLSDGHTLVFRPQKGYTGQASITVQADELVLINIERIQSLALGQNKRLNITGDFEDQAGVSLPSDYLHFVSDNENILSVDAQGNLHAKGEGIAHVKVRARGIEGVNAISVGVEEGGYGGIELDVYPLTIALPVSGQRQLKVSEADGSRIDASVKGTTYHISDRSLADISADGLITAKRAGKAKVSVINKGRQYDLISKNL